MRVIDNPKFQPRELPESNLWSQISVAVDKMFGDIPEDFLGEDVPIEMLKRCYVKTRSSYEQVFDMAPMFQRSQVVDAFEFDGNWPGAEKSTEIDGDEALPLRAEISSCAPKVVLLIGDIGVGKSTFLWYHKRVTLAEEGILCAIVNIGSPPSREYLCASVRRDLKRYMDRRIDEMIQGGLSSDYITFTAYEDVLRRHKDALADCQNDLARRSMKREIIQNYERQYPEERLRRELDFIRQRTGKPIAIILDEVDRLPDEELRDYLLDYARDLAEELSTIVIMATRIYTPALILERKLAGRRYRVLKLPPPDFSEVIKKRIDYIAEQIEKDPRIKVTMTVKPTLVYKDTSRNIELHSRDLVQFLNTCCEALLQEGNIRCIENLCNRDVRLALMLVSTVISSPHLHENVLKLICGFAPAHHDLVHILALGSLPRYNPESSFIINMFDNNDQDHIEEGNSLIRIRALQVIAYLTRCQEARSNPNSVISAMEGIGYNRRRVEFVLHFLINSDLINTDDRTAPHRKGLDEIGDLRLTRSGAYYLGWLIYELMYLEDVQDAVHWLASDVPFPQSNSESRKQRQDRVAKLVDRIRSDENIERNHVEEDKSCDQSLYDSIVGESLSDRLKKEHKRELDIIRRTSYQLAHTWNFRQDRVADCEIEIGEGVLHIERGKNGKLVAVIDTRRRRICGQVEQQGLRLLLWLTEPTIRIKGELTKSGRYFNGLCDCSLVGRGHSVCKFQAVAIG